MSEEMKDTTILTPTLTLDPFEEEAQVMQSAAPAMTPEEQRMVDEFASKIELSNSNLILQYGSGAQKKIADFSESALNNVRTKDLGEVGSILSGVVTELKNFDADENEKGFLGLFKRTSNKLTNMKAKYDKAEVNVNKICTVLENHQIQLLKDVAMLDKMYDMNRVYFKELSMYILA